MILIGADFVPTKSNYDLFRRGQARELFGEALQKLLEEADYRIFNLETPLCDTLSPIPKNGANFASPTDCVNAYRQARADLLTLANNHILDQGEQGLRSTWRTLEQAGIAQLGTGVDRKAAAQAYSFSYHGKRIGVYACAEHEYSIAGPSRMGANPYEPLETPTHLSGLKADCDYLIVLYHGGKEFYRYPSPALQQRCRNLAEHGADLVICQHSHCIGCEERWNHAVIVYGQGNFLFDNSDAEPWQTGLLVGVDDDFSIAYYPLCKDGTRVRLAEDAQAREILDGFSKRSAEIREEGFVTRQFSELAAQALDHYLYSISGPRSMLFRMFNKLSGGRLKKHVSKRIGKQQRLELRNYMECESLRELILAGLYDRDKMTDSGSVKSL